MPNTPALCCAGAFLTSAAEKPSLQKRHKKIHRSSELSVHRTSNAPGLTPAKERWNPRRLQTEIVLGTVALLHLDYVSASAGPDHQRCKALATHVDWLQILGCLCTFKWENEKCSFAVFLFVSFFLSFSVMDRESKISFFLKILSILPWKIDGNVVESAAMEIWWSKLRKSIPSITAFVLGKQVEKRLKMVAGLEVIQRLSDWKAEKGQSPTGWWWQVKHLQAENHFGHKRAAAAIWGARKIRNDPRSSYTAAFAWGPSVEAKPLNEKQEGRNSTPLDKIGSSLTIKTASETRDPSRHLLGKRNLDVNCPLVLKYRCFERPSPHCSGHGLTPGPCPHGPLEEYLLQTHWHLSSGGVGSRGCWRSVWHQAGEVHPSPATFSLQGWCLQGANRPLTVRRVQGESGQGAATFRHIFFHDWILDPFLSKMAYQRPVAFPHGCRCLQHKAMDPPAFAKAQAGE